MRWSSTHRMLAVAPLILCVILAGCHAKTDSTQTASGKPVKGGNLTVALPKDPGVLDTVQNTNAGVTYIGHEVFEQLYTMDADFKPKPALAKSYEKSDGGRTYTFALRKGVRFSDGTPLKASDAVASLKYWAKKGSYGDTLKKVLQNMKAPDRSTLVIHLKTPFHLIPLLADSIGAGIRKASDIAAAKPSGIPDKHQVGTGPYKLKSWSPGQKMTLERNDRYRPPKGKSSGYAGHKHAYLDTITYKFVSDPDATLHGLQAGLWDVAEPTNDQYEQVQQTGNLKSAAEGQGNLQFVAFNHHHQSIFSKPKARNALNLLIDQEAIRKTQSVSKLVDPSDGAFAAKGDKAMYSDKGKAKSKRHDPKRAKKLFAEAGLKSGQKIRMITTDEFPKFKDALVIIQDELRKIGIKASISSYDFGTMLDQEKKPGRWDLLALMDDAYLPSPGYSDNVTDLDSAGYPQKKLQPLLDKYQASQTAATERRAIDKIQVYTSRHLPTIPLYTARSYVAYNEKLHGYDGWGLEFADTWLAK